MADNIVIVEIDCAWDEEKLEAALPHLQPASRERADRYLCLRSRRTLIASHTQLDRVIKAVEGKPENLSRASNGRPFLADHWLEFNLSHSHQRAALILGGHPSLNLSLGVDIEWIDRRTDFEGLSERFFTTAEHRWVGGDRSRFFHIWTRKEAILKSNGVGLRVELDSFEVLKDQVEEYVCGAPLVLATSPRSERYTISWALPPGQFKVHFLSDTDPNWAQSAAKLLREGIAAQKT